MRRWIRPLVIVAASGLAALVLVLGIAWAFMPREWISKEAQRIAARSTGADVRWKRLEPGFDGLSLGVRVEGLAVRMPPTGDVRVDARVNEVFVRFKLIPLLFRRVEIAAARVRGAGIAMWDRGPMPKPPHEKKPPSAIALSLPRLDLDGIDLRTRDVYGGGVDIRRLHGSAEFEGTLDAPRAVRLDATAESLFWKGSARDPLLPLPSPLRAQVAFAGAARSGGGRRLDVTHGVATLGPLRSDVRGSIALPPEPEPAAFDLTIAGAQQEMRSSDPAFRALAKASPATWSTKASWEIKIRGTAEAPVQEGTVVLRPIEVASGPNKFTLDQIRAQWATGVDKTFTAAVAGGGSGLALRVNARGSMLPGGQSSGTFEMSAPAERLNGLAPNTPTWGGGSLGVTGSFATRAPAPPAITWVATGRDLRGSAPGLQQPIHRMAFEIAGGGETVSIRAFEAKVGSSTAKATGTMTMGKPLGTGQFTAHVDRFIAEEWAPPPGAKAAPKKGAPQPPPALPFRRLTAAVTVGELKQGGMIVKDISVPVLYDAGTLKVAPIKGTVGTGSIAGEVTVRDLVRQPSYALHLDVQKAPVQDVTRGLIPFNLGITGIVNGVVDLAGPGLPGPEVSDSLRGSLSGTVEDGKIAETESLRMIRSALGLGGQTDLAFKTLTHVLRIERGRLLLDRVKGDLGVDKFELTGAMGLDRALALKLLVRLAPERVKGGGKLGELARYARDADGRIPVELSIGGTTKAPRVQLKSGKLLDVAGQGLKESFTKSLEQKLTPPPRTASDSTAARADTAGAHHDSTAQDPLQKGRDALRRLLGK